MLRRRIKEWGYLKNRKEKEMKAVLRALRLSWTPGQVFPEIKLQGKLISYSQVKTFFQKKVPGTSLANIPTPSEAETKDVVDLEVVVKEVSLSNTRAQEVLPSARANLENGVQQQQQQRGYGEECGYDELHNTALPLRNRRWLAYNIDPGPAILPSYFRLKFEPLTDTDCQGSPNYHLTHPRELLRLWREIMIDTDQVPSFWASGSTLEIMGLARPLVTQEHPLFVFYVLFLRRLAEFCPYARHQDMFCSCTPSRGLTHRSIWAQFSAKLVCEAESAKGWHHPLTIAIGLATLDNSSAESLYTDMLLTFLKMRGKDSLYQRLKLDEIDVNFVTASGMLQPNDEANKYFYRLKTREWSSSGLFDQVQPRNLSTCFPTSQDVVEYPVVEAAAQIEQVKTDDVPSSFGLTHAEDSTMPSYIQATYTFVDFRFQYFKDIFGVPLATAQNPRMLLGSWARMASNFAILGKESAFQEHLSEFTAFSQSFVHTEQHGMLIIYLLLLRMTIPLSPGFTPRLHILKQRQLLIWWRTLNDLERNSIEVVGMHNGLLSTLNHITQTGFTRNSISLLLSQLLECLIRVRGEHDEVTLCIQRDRADVESLFCAFESNSVDEALLMLLQWHRIGVW